MKNRLWLILFMMAFGAGCAPGYYAPKSAYQPPSYWEGKAWYQNPETEEEWRMRIWRMDSGR
ncbi:MAG: hypothetical protein AB1424_01330 [Thermodesulfobacteriota bacterium]